MTPACPRGFFPRVKRFFNFHRFRNLKFACVTKVESVEIFKAFSNVERNVRCIAWFKTSKKQTVKEKKRSFLGTSDHRTASSMHVFSSDTVKGGGRGGGGRRRSRSYSHVKKSKASTSMPRQPETSTFFAPFFFPPIRKNMDVCLDEKRRPFHLLLPRILSSNLLPSPERKVFSQKVHRFDISFHLVYQ